MMVAEEGRSQLGRSLVADSLQGVVDTIGPGARRRPHATAAEKAANMEPVARYPGERWMAITFLTLTWVMSLWILSSMIAVISQFNTLRYSTILTVVGTLTLLMAGYSFKIGFGALVWVHRYNRAKSRDYREKWELAKQEDRCEEGSTESVRAWDDVNHFVIVTAYKEPMEHLMSVAYTLIAQRTHQGASQRFSKQHITLVVAIEEREGQEAVAKVDEIKRHLGNYFKEVIHTAHPPDLPGDIKGKASNYRWAVKEIDERIAQGEFPDVKPENCLIHVGDGDSMYDPNHFPYITWDFCTNKKRDLLMWQPCMIPTCNFWKLPSVVRQFTIMITAQEMMAGSGIGEFQIPFSTYGLSLPLLQRIGGEDGAAGAQDGDVITEDHHLFAKGFCATGGRLAVRPVTLPCFNHTVEGQEWCERGCVVTLCSMFVRCRWLPCCCCRRRGEAPAGPCDSRFTQATRHMIGIAEFFYFLSMILRRGCKFEFGVRWYRVLGLFLKFLQIHSVCYQGLWLIFGGAMTLLIKVMTQSCHQHNILSKIHMACIKDWDAYTATLGAYIFGVASGLALLGVFLVFVSFVMMLRATQDAMDNIADPNADPPMDPDFEAVQRRLVHPGKGAAWIGTFIELLLEYFVCGLPASVLYALIPSQIALKNIICIGHRLQYVSATEGQGA